MSLIVHSRTKATDGKHICHTFDLLKVWYLRYPDRKLKLFSLCDCFFHFGRLLANCPLWQFAESIYQPV